MDRIRLVHGAATLSNGDVVMSTRDMIEEMCGIESQPMIIARLETEIDRLRTALLKIQNMSLAKYVFLKLDENHLDQTFGVEIDVVLTHEEFTWLMDLMELLSKDPSTTT